MPQVVQRSFASGEVTPELFARTDIKKYSSGLKTCRNFIVNKKGLIESRSGTKLIGNTKFTTGNVRLVPFIFSDDEALVLEFGDNYMRVIKDGEYLGSPYELTTEYTSDQVKDISYTQLGNTVTIAHPAHPPRDLKRVTNTEWTIDSVSFNNEVPSPSNMRTTDPEYTGENDGVFHAYQVTAISRTTNEESLPGYSGTKVPITSNSVAPGTNRRLLELTTQVDEGYYEEGDLIDILLDSDDSVIDRTRITEVSISSKKITHITIDTNVKNLLTFPTDTIAFRFVGIRVRRSSSNEELTRDNRITFKWDQVDDAREYNIYKYSEGVYGFIGISKTTTFEDTGIELLQNDQPPEEVNIFDRDNEYPGAVVYAHQRLCFGRTNNNVESIRMSRTGQYRNFTTSSPIQENDSISFSAASRDVNEVRHLLELKDLVLFTSGGIWAVKGDEAGIIGPQTINLRRYYHNGANKLVPIVAGDNALYVQNRGSIVRDLVTSDNNGYKGSDLTTYSTHLTEGFTIIDWAYQETPNSIVWMVRSDGVVIALTYLAEQEVVAWHRHDFDGFVESVTSIPDDKEDAVYFVVRRTINNATVKTVEYISGKRFSDLDSYVGMDSLIENRQDKVDPQTSLAFTNSGVTTISGSSISTLTVTSADPIGSGIQQDATVTSTEFDFNLFDFNSDRAIRIFPEGESNPYSFRPETIVNNNEAIGKISNIGLFEYPASAINVAIEDWNYAYEVETPFTLGNIVQCESSLDIFNINDVGARLEVETDSGNIYYFLIESFDSETIVNVTLQQNVPNTFQEDGPYSNWRILKKKVTGLSNLEGKDVVVIQDTDTLISNPLNQRIAKIRVTNGEIEIQDDTYTRLRIGLPITCDVETLDIEPAGDQTLYGSGKVNKRAYIYVNQSRGIWVGSKEVEDGSLEGLNVLKPRSTEHLGSSPMLKSGVVEVNIVPEWTNEGRIFIRHIDPLPITILAIARSGNYPKNQNRRN